MKNIWINTEYDDTQNVASSPISLTLEQQDDIISESLEDISEINSLDDFTFIANSISEDPDAVQGESSKSMADNYTGPYIGRGLRPPLSPNYNETWIRPVMGWSPKCC